jgi:hypothetical protein
MSVIFIIASWEIWKLRNGKIFDDQSSRLGLWIMRFKEKVLLHLYMVPEGMNNEGFSM